MSMYPWKKFIQVFIADRSISHGLSHARMLGLETKHSTRMQSFNLKKKKKNEHFNEQIEIKDFYY